MNLLRRLTPFLFFACIILLPYYCQAEDKDWKSYVEGDPFMNSYDPGSLTRPSRDIVKVRVKDECIDKAKCRAWHRKWIAESKSQMRPEYERFAYRISTIEIQCKAGKIRYLSGRSVDEDGKTIEEYDDPTTWLDARNPWHQPNDPQEELWKLLCK